MKKEQKRYFYKELNGRPSSKEIPEFTLHREKGPALIEQFLSGEINHVYYADGLIHRDFYLPAFIYHYQLSIIGREEWYQRGVLHRDLAPAIKGYPFPGVDDYYIEVWMKDGLEHRTDGPSKYCYLGLEPCFGATLWEEYKQGGEYFRIEKPAMVHYFISVSGAKIESMEWRNVSQKPLAEPNETIYSDEEEKAVIKNWHYYPSSTLGPLLHREDGPAQIFYNKKGEVTKELWWLEGKEIKK